ncbi:MAG: LPP20 family lipoprotein [Deltaproteobacteria bacterium]|nr:LPP20 family lipoprotein [Deltaproteobacteria bacterium]
MKPIKIIALLSLIFFSLVGCASRPATVKEEIPDTIKKRTPRFLSLDDALDYTGKALSNELKEIAKRDFGTSGKASVIVIADFATVEGKITRFSRYIADKLTPYFARSKNFSVLERALIDKVIQEHKFQASPFVDEDSTQEFGKLLGAETIIAGTISELGNAFYINTKAVDVTKGNILSSLDVEIRRNARMVELYNADLPHLNKKKVITKVFRAQGIGIPSPKHTNKSVARALAFRAAKGDAMRNLLEQIQSTQVTSDTKIKDMMAENDTVRIQLNSSLRGARVVNKKQMPDGSVEVEMEVELTEDLINTLYSQ